MFSKRPDKTFKSSKCRIHLTGAAPIVRQLGLPAAGAAVPGQRNRIYKFQKIGAVLPTAKKRVFSFDLIRSFGARSPVTLPTLCRSEVLHLLCFMIFFLFSCFKTQKSRKTNRFRLFYGFLQAFIQFGFRGAPYSNENIGSVFFR